MKDKKATLETACEMATAMEVAATDSSLMAQTQKDPIRVQHLQRRRESRSLTKKQGTCKTREKVLPLHKIRAYPRLMQVQKCTMLQLWKKRPY